MGYVPTVVVPIDISGTYGENIIFSSPIFTLIPGGFIYASYTPPSLENLKRDDVYTRSLPPNVTLVYQVWHDLETYEVM